MAACHRCAPSTQPPQGYSVAWLNEQWRLLKEKAPDLQIAEWSMHPHDRVLYERNLSRAKYNPDDVLPETTSWVSPMQWLQYSSPSLPGYQLGYVGSIRWTAREESLMLLFSETHMQTSPNDARDQLLRATSIYLVTEGYFRNPKRIYVRLERRSCSPFLQLLYGTYDGDAKEIDMALLGLYETTSLKHCDTCGTRCIKAGNFRKCNPIKCVSCGGNTPSWLKECSRYNDKTKRLRGRTKQ
ncbi:hypothetical protein X797_003217 [Metarhizium robertsii]|uniref:Uncharacterized protein n=1 Tax=Metarhizium robertsii TaxID=568076 RepID=A0A0A1UZG5_9HYPO|nr:hypothetical protein X797_003217 [Metarhizium robertsii]